MENNNDSLKVINLYDWCGKSDYAKLMNISTVGIDRKLVAGKLKFIEHYGRVLIDCSHVPIEERLAKLGAKSTKFKTYVCKEED